VLVAVLAIVGGSASAEARASALGLGLITSQDADAVGDARRGLARLGVAPRQVAGLTLQVTTSKPSYGPAQTLVAGVDVDNTRGSGLVDFYLGVILPDGVTVVSLGFGQVLSVGSLTDLRSLTPVARGVGLGTPFRVAESSLFQHVFTGGEPAGSYLLFLAATTPGALDDGALGPGELLALTTQAFRFDAGGILLPGDPAAPAASAMFDLDVIDGVPESEIETDAGGARFARTLIELGFTPNATVGQVNALLQSINGRIVSMLEGVLLAVVQIPDPGSLAALDGLLAQLRADPIVRLATRAGFDEPTALPDNVPLSSAALLDHHLAVRAHAAWNTRAALVAPGTAEPLVLIGDFFGGGPPGPDFDVNDIHVDYGTAGTNRHGYHVLGIVAGSFGGPGTNAGVVTGLFPGTTRLRVVDLALAPGPLLDNRIVQLARLAGGNVVVNTSLGEPCNTAALELQLCNPVAAASRAVSWLEKLRLGTVTVAGSGLEARVLHVTAAGNLLFPGGNQDARFGLRYASARLLSGLATFLGTPVPNATNTLVIENRTNRSSAPFEPDCLALSSWRGGDLSAMGTSVLSMTAAIDQVDFLTGTSMATPQTAALAAWVWTLRPTLTPQAVMQVLQRTARPPNPACAGPLLGKPVIDAYAAVLATDQGFANAPVRRALLDVADAAGNPGQDGRFDERDIQRFLVELGAAGGTSFDFSRFDLNGDALTGGPETEAFDLDMDGVLGSVSLVTPQGSRTLNENGVRDIDVLCFYAFSALFQGSAAARDQFLDGLCIPAVAMLTGQLTFNSHAGVPGVSLDTVFSIFVTAEVSRQGVIELRTVTGTGSETYTYASSAEFNCGSGITATGRPPETTSGTVIGGSGLGILDGDPLAQPTISPRVSGTRTATNCNELGVWTTSTEPFEGSLSSIRGTPIVSNGSTIAIDFNRDFTDSFGERFIVTGRLERGL
jgi:hypothetical protein